MRKSLLLCLLIVSTAWGQEAATPFIPEMHTSTVSSGTRALDLLAARRAQAMGFPSTALSLYEQALEAGAGGATEIKLAMATALMDLGRLEEAAATLQSVGDSRGAAWRLRAGLLAAQRGEAEQAAELAAAVNVEALDPQDLGWYYFLQGRLARRASDFKTAREFFEKAEGAAASQWSRARFQLAREETRLGAGPVDAAALEEVRSNMERMSGRRTGYGFARTYAVMLYGLGRSDEAVNVLRQQLLQLPEGARRERDDFLLLLGLIAGPETGTGRQALSQLLEEGEEVAKRRMALRLLARHSTEEPAHTEFLNELDKMISGHPGQLLEDLLLVRAESLLNDKNYAASDADARQLLEKFPGSSLKVHALGLLTSSAWEQKRYRAAADMAGQAREALKGEAGAQARAQLGLLVAEAWFRAKDYPSAASAYAAVLRDPPSGVPLGALMFQRVLADIRAGQLTEAQAHLDEMLANENFDPVNRWRAEWNLSRALQASGHAQAAFERVEKLLSEPAGEQSKLPAELRARMAWLRARLALDTGRARETLKLAEAFHGSLDGVSAQLQRKVESSTSLLEAEALFELGRKDEALAKLQSVRDKFPKSDAAINSYVVEAGHYAAQGQIVEAQRLYTKLADTFPDNQVYAPYALYQAALQAERRGLDANFVEANKLIEDMVRRFPNSPLVFYARLKQGDLLRKLNQFPQAQQVYESLVNKHPLHRDVILAQLALAECHNAQSLNGGGHAERAISLFEHLRDRVDAPVDVRIEAGFNLGYLLVRKGQTERAAAVWWRDVVNGFLLDQAMAKKMGSKGRYWMTRTLLELGALYERQARFEQARDAWLLIVKTGLPGAELAKDRIDLMAVDADDK